MSLSLGASPSLFCTVPEPGVGVWSEWTGFLPSPRVSVSGAGQVAVCLTSLSLLGVSPDPQPNTVTLGVSPSLALHSGVCELQIARWRDLPTPNGNFQGEGSVHPKGCGQGSSSRR